MHLPHLPAHSTLKRQLNQMSISPRSINFRHYANHNVVYIKIPIPTSNKHYAKCKHTTTYIGSTRHATKREANRTAKYRLLKRKQLPKCELALHWWNDHDNLHDFSTMVTTPLTSYSQAWIQEHKFIDRFEPTLNYPFLGKHYVKKTSGYTKVSFSNSMTYRFKGHRLFRRLRKMHYNQATSTIDLHNSSALTTIQSLASNTKQSFQASRLLLSNRFTPDEIYALRRVNHHLEEPHKSIAQAKINKCMEKRQLPTPVSNLPLKIPSLGHPQFFKQVKVFLKEHIIHQKQQCLPFHIPTATVVETPHYKVGNTLFNYKQWEHQFTLKPPTTCQCAQFIAKFPNATHKDGHIATPLSTILTPEPLQQMARYSAESGYYLAKTEYLELTTTSIQKWAKHHSIHISNEDWKKFMEQQWPIHLQHIDQDKAFTRSQAQSIRNTTSNHFVIHNEDHKAAKLMAYCPIRYYKALQKTWLDPSTFEVLQMTPPQLQTYATQLIPGRIQHTYQWGIKSNATMPTGQCLLKAKKNYEKGRTILNYRGFILTKLLQAITVALNAIITTVFGPAMGTTPMPTIIKQLHQFLAQQPPHNNNVYINDDLVGFFNAIPQAKIISDVERLLTDYCRISNKTLRSATVTVDLSKSGSKFFKTTAGSTTYHSNAQHHHLNHKVIHLKDIPTIIQTSFDLGIVVVMGKCISQIQGSPIGNQASPTLCNIVVLYRELEWQREYHTWLNGYKHHIYMQRYVDNRFIITTPTIMQSKALAAFTETWFYNKPIELESVGDEHFLGLNVYPKTKECHPILPTEMWQIKPANSAGSLNFLLSGFKSRLHLITTNTFPRQQASSFQDQLIQLYEQAGFKTSQLRLIARRQNNGPCG